MSKPDDTKESSSEETAVSGRRDFLKKAGKFAIYTPPAMMLMMKPSYATFNKSMVGRPNKHHYRKYNKKHHYKKYNKKHHYKKYQKRSWW